MNIKRLLNSEAGKIVISIILGLGLASLFRKVCVDKNCITFNGVVISDIEDKTYKHGESCYKYKAKTEKCDEVKKVVPITDKKPTTKPPAPKSFF
jgi:hypothetical protein